MNRQISTLVMLLILGCTKLPPPKDTREFDLKAIPKSSELGTVRDWQPTRGVIHLHSVYSHDACDEHGFTNAAGEKDYTSAGSMNVACFQQLRQALCDGRQDWVFLTDHNSYMSQFDWKDLLLYQQGDTLTEKDGQPWVNEIHCADGHKFQLAAGIDYDLIAIGLQGHVAATMEDRQKVYGQRTPEAIAALHSVGAVALAGYIPRWDEEQLYALPFDGFEVYNPVFNLQRRATDILSYVLESADAPAAWPKPEAIMLGVFEENQEALARWAHIVQLKRMPNYVGPNAHQNAFSQVQSDGERLDSYRRLLHWFSNYALIPKGEPLTIEKARDAVLKGHLYSAFEFVGTPQGFDFYAQGSKTWEVGDVVPKGELPTLHVSAPRVAGLPPSAKVPEISVRIMKAGPGDAWTEVARQSGNLSFTVTVPGVYRAEARIVPHHLEKWLGENPSQYIHDTLWVYGNSIYIGMDY